MAIYFWEMVRFGLGLSLGWSGVYVVDTEDHTAHVLIMLVMLRKKMTFILPNDVTQVKIVCARVG